MAECVWCDRDCTRCGYPIDGGFEHMAQAQAAEAGLVICTVRRVVRPLVDALVGYLDHRHIRLPQWEPGPLEWTCMVCGQWRPDDKIAVAHRELELKIRGKPLQFNVRYCVDSARCVAYATADGPWMGKPQVPA